MGGVKPKTNTPSGRAFDSWMRPGGRFDITSAPETISGSIPGAQGFSTMNVDTRFDILSTAASIQDGKLRTSINSQLDNVWFDANGNMHASEVNAKNAGDGTTAVRYEFDAEGNFVQRQPQSTTGAPAANTPDAPAAPDAPVAADTLPDTASVTKQDVNNSIPEVKNKLQPTVDRLKKSSDPKQVELGNYLETLSTKNINDLTDAELNTLKKAINDASPEHKGILNKLYAMVGNNKTLFIAAAALMMYEGYERRKKQARENRRQCKEQCKPIAFDAWSLGAITIDQLTDPPEGNQNTINCDDTCWNSSGDKSDHFCTAGLTPDPDSCETYCTTKCNEKFPMPNPNPLAEASQNLGAGAAAAAESGMDLFTSLTEDFFDKLLSMFDFDLSWLLWIFLGFFGIIVVVVVISMISKRKKS